MLEFEDLGTTCPEQYDVMRNGQRIAYVRLRHGNYTVECPDVGGETVLSMLVPNHAGNFSDENKDFYLKLAAEVIVTWLNDRQNIVTSAEYEVIK